MSPSLAAMLAAGLTLVNMPALSNYLTVEGRKGLLSNVPQSAKYVGKEILGAPVELEWLSTPKTFEIFISFTFAQEQDVHGKVRGIYI